jgi:biopolymer transport protein ExbD
MFHKRVRRRARPGEELNITAFMNVLVVLVSFLLATAVFSHVAKLEMNLPGGGESAGDATVPPLVLEITLRADQIEVGDRNSGLMQEIPRKDDKHDYVGLTEYLRRVKAQFPDIVDATVLAEETTPYDDIIQAMDAVRVDVRKENGQWVNAELFPQVSLGSATADPRPVATGGTP